MGDCHPERYGWKKAEGRQMTPLEEKAFRKGVLVGLALSVTGFFFAHLVLLIQAAL